MVRNVFILLCWFAVVCPDNYKAYGKMRFKAISEAQFDPLRMSGGRSETKRAYMEYLMKKSLASYEIGEEEFTESIIGQRVFQEEIRHAKDASYAAQRLRRDIRIGPLTPKETADEVVKDPNIHSIASERLRKKTGNVERFNKVKKSAITHTIVEYSARLSGMV